MADRFYRTLTREQAEQVLVMARQMQRMLELHHEVPLKANSEWLAKDAALAKEHGDAIQAIICTPPAAPETIFYGSCEACGADDCRYEPIGPLCPDCGAEWSVISSNLRLTSIADGVPAGPSRPVKVF